MSKKKLLSSLLVIAMMMWMMPMKVFGADTITLSVSPSTVEAHPGDEIKFTFKMGEIQGFTNMDFKVQASQGLTLKDGSNKVNSAFKEAMGEDGSASLKVNNGVPKFTAYAETTYSSNDESTLGELTYTVTGDVNSTATITLIGVDANAGETKLQPTLTGATVNITPAPVDLTSITIDPSSVNLTVDGTQRLTAIPNAGADLGTVTWSSNNSNVASVDNTGFVKGISEGSATITATSGNVSGTCTVTVTKCQHNGGAIAVVGYENYQGETCTTDGHYKCFGCIECGMYVVDEGNGVLEAYADPDEAKAAAVIPAGHLEDQTWSYDEVNHWKECTRPGHTGDLKIDSTVAAHTFGDASYALSDNKTECTAEKKCKDCEYKKTETKPATKQVTQQRTCEQPEMSVYTATFDNFAAYTSDPVKTGDALGHDWGAVAYSWSADYKQCTATKTCSRDTSHKLTQTVSTTVKETTATCTNAGTTIYEATFTTAGLEGKAESDPVSTDALGHDYITTIVNEVTDTEDGLMVTKCQRCGDETQKVIPALSKGQAKQLVASVPMNGENIGLVIQDPYEVLPDGTKLIVELAEKDSARWNELSPQLDDKYPIENIAFFDIKLTDLQGNQLPMPLTQKVRVLIQNPNGWDKEDLEAVLVSSGADIDFEESIVTKDGVDYLAFWTDHFSPYAVIDKLTDAEAAELAAISAAEKAEKGKGGLKTGETIEMYVTFSMILFSAAGILLISLKKRKKAE